MKKRVLHVCNLDKFIPPFIDLVEEHFGLEDHYFWLNGDHAEYPVQQEHKVYKVQTSKLKGLIVLIREMFQADKIILHGLFKTFVILLLWAMPWLLKKCYWVQWGGDLYVYKYGKKDWKWRVREFFRRPVIKNMGFLVNYTDGDYELTKKWYGAKGHRIKCFFYTSNLYKEINTHAQQGRAINILIGNSANPSNNHLEIFHRIEQYKDQRIKIYVPLSYGIPEYANSIIAEGKMRFGSKFEPLTEFMHASEYLEFLSRIDIAIFNHKRQQAMGNIRTLLGMGKKVFMRDDTTSFESLVSDGIKVFKVDEISLDRDFDEQLDNQLKIKRIFSEQNLVDCLSNIWKL